MTMVRGYLDARRIVASERTVLEQTIGVTQGSVLGLLLWNISYDNVLSLGMPVDCQLVAYADHLPPCAVR